MTGGFYAFSVWAEGEVPLPEIYVVLERGQNGFNCVLKDLDAFLQKLETHGVRLLKPPAKLDDHEPIPVEWTQGLPATDTSSDAVALGDVNPRPGTAPEPQILVASLSEDIVADAADASPDLGRGGVDAARSDPEGL